MENQRESTLELGRSGESEEVGCRVRRNSRVALRSKFVDSVMGMLIAVGGVSTILALLLVVMVLIGTVLPLLRPTDIGEWQRIQSPIYAHFGIDDNGTTIWGVDDLGKVEARSLQNGSLLVEYPAFAKSEAPTASMPTCSVCSPGTRALAFGFEDGSIRTSNISFQEELLGPASNSGSRVLPSSAESEGVMSEGAMFQAVDDLGLRRIKIAPVVWSERLRISDNPIVALDYIPAEAAAPFVESEPARLAAIDRDATGNSKLLWAAIRKPAFALSDTELEVSCIETEILSRAKDGKPMAIMAVADQRHVVVIWASGTVDRYSVSKNSIEYQESVSLVLGKEKLTRVSIVSGRQTLVCGTNQGRLLAVTVANAGTSSSMTPGNDGFEIRISHQLPLGDAGIVAVASAPNSKLVAALDEDDQIHLAFLTTDKVLAQDTLSLSESKIQSSALLAFDARAESLYLATNSELWKSKLEARNYDASAKTYFSRVWYEGHDSPEYIWQPSAANESSEAKLSLIPLLFGTIKATCFAMLIAVPLALMAAIYSSEFFSAPVRSSVKPAIELMASIPGVVMGYIVAVVFAPVLRENVVPLFVAAVMVPVTYLFLGRLWAILESNLTIRSRKRFEFLLLLVAIPLSLFVCKFLARIFEFWWFEGNFLQWISTKSGAGTGGWIITLFPLLSFILIASFATRLNRLCSRLAVGNTQHLLRASVIAVFPAVILVLSWWLASTLDSFGWDLRDSLMNSFQERNAMLVGFALTFCVIPLVFTLADDALQAVPKDQRFASFACGATTWQTTMRIVIPSAVSGLVSACVVGLGRVVGETMIVLMVVGNTPLMEWNPFSGLRALTATLATELPEAAKGSTHYRTLFLAALMLFAFTLAANTLAEYVRLRGRKRMRQA